MKEGNDSRHARGNVRPIFFAAIAFVLCAAGLFDAYQSVSNGVVSHESSRSKLVIFQESQPDAFWRVVDIDVALGGASGLIGIVVLLYAWRKAVSNRAIRPTSQ